MITHVTILGTVEIMLTNLTYKTSMGYTVTIRMYFEHPLTLTFLWMNLMKHDFS